jgi:hypothetical protein
MKSDMNRRQLLIALTKLMCVPAIPFWNSTKAYGNTPRRMIFIYLPNGSMWQPSESGAQFTFPFSLSPLAPFRDYVTIVSGVGLPAAKDTKAGDHARAGGSFLTGVKPGFPGPGVVRSLDLQIADQIGKDTPHALLSLGGEGGSGSDGGYHDSYQSHISWANNQGPYTKETSPKAVFDRLFRAPGIDATKAGNGVGQGGPSRASDKSVLDFALRETEALKAKLPKDDRQKLEEYLTSLRELETRMGQTTQGISSDLTCSTPQSAFSATPTYEQRIGQFYDLMFHALQCGLTRVVTFMLGNEASNISYPFAGVPGSHHEISHDASASGQEKLSKIVHWHTKSLAQFVERLQKTREGSGTMLDNTLILYGSGIADGARHTHDNLPLVVLGKVEGIIPGGRHIQGHGAPLANLQLTLARALGIQWNQFGDSSGSLSLG